MTYAERAREKYNLDKYRDWVSNKYNNTINKYYLSQILKFNEIKNQLTGISRGVRQANISIKDILSLSVPIPPIELQDKFADFVKQTDKSKLEIQKSLDKLEILKKSLMQQYFDWNKVLYLYSFRCFYNKRLRLMSDEIIAAFIGAAATIIVAFFKKDKIFKNKKVKINQKSQNINQSIQIGIQNNYSEYKETNKEGKKDER